MTNEQRGGAGDIAIGVDSYAADPTACPGRPAKKGCVYVLVTGPNENTPRGIGCAVTQVFNLTASRKFLPGWRESAGAARASR